MIAVFIFALHLVAAGYAFETRRRKGGMSEGLLAVAFMTLIFSVGWSMTTMVTRLLFPTEGLAEWFDADAISLVLLTLGEGGFYAIVLRLGKRSEEDSERSTST